MNDTQKQAQRYEQWICSHKTEYEFLRSQVMTIAKSDQKKIISLNEIIDNHNIDVTHNARAYILRRIEQDCAKAGLNVHIRKAKSQFDELFQSNEPRTFSDFMHEKEMIAQNESLEAEPQSGLAGVLGKLARKFQKVFHAR